MIVPVSRYREFSGDTATDDAVVARALARAQDRVERRLNRALDLDDYTETLPVVDGLVYPSQTPVTVALAGATLRSATALQVTSEGWFDQAWMYSYDASYCNRVAQVSYTGGWTADTLPVDIEDVLLAVTRHYIGPVSEVLASMPDNVKSVSVGDIAMTFVNAPAVLPPEIYKALAPYAKRRPLIMSQRVVLG